MSASTVEYRVRFDDAYWRTTRDRLSPARRYVRWLVSAAVGAFLVLCLGLALQMAGDGEWGLFALVIGVVAALVVYVWVRAPRELAEYRRTPDFGADVRVTIAASGVEIDGPAASTHFPPGAVRRVVTHPNGILLDLADRGGLWAPDAGLVRGSREAAIEIATESLLAR